MIDEIQDEAQRRHRVLLPKQFVYENALMVQHYRTKWAICYQRAPAHKPENFQPAEQRYYVFAIDASTNAPAESLGILLQIVESLDAAIAVAAGIDGTTS